MTYARRETVADGEIGIYHCVTRCVRRAFLCGQDPVSGKSFEHRKEWVRERLEFLAGIFGIDVCGYAILSNHLHAVLRTRPDVVRDWSDAEVAVRWLRLCPLRRNPDGSPAEPDEREIQALVADTALCADRRARLANLSWFMACLAQWIARRANREEHCRGRFFEGRFKCQMLLDDAAILACSLYVDLNPIRAGIAATPEESQFTSAYDRIRGRQATTEEACSLQSPDGWLCPLTLASSPPSETLAVAKLDLDNTICAMTAQSAAPDPAPGCEIETPAPAALVPSAPVRITRRASDKGYLPLKLDEYLSLLDWTGRQLRADKWGAIPADLAPILNRLHVKAEKWIETVGQFGRWFRRAVGTVAQVKDCAIAHGRRWYQGIRHCADAFG